MKIVPTITSLNIHITVVHDKLKAKHPIEKKFQRTWRIKSKRKRNIRDK